MFHYRYKRDRDTDQERDRADWIVMTGGTQYWNVRLHQEGIEACRDKIDFVKISVPERPPLLIDVEP
ncbi:hypothetical protein [Paenibacillus mendelii]|uniref:Uncharacterized protein n=1 Tax=Paenibacillus mendelii TaxID=206163 RepID=A0ABV6J757_9BACL|nr:hypothetical protein [Paenibacillus mendelii]MCQ6560001.1 hypothetical protein [Paenibacillus mendelii]